MCGNITDCSGHDINEVVRTWRQGDVCIDTGLESLHLADLSAPHSEASRQAAESAREQDLAAGPVAAISTAIPGLVILSQTCDIIRDCNERPFVEVAPLVELSAQLVEEVRLLRRPAFAYVPAVAHRLLVADLDRPMTVEKALLTRWNRLQGCRTDEQLRDFVLALSRKRSRFAFPDDFVRATQRVQGRLAAKHNKQTLEGDHLRALREIRVRAAPSWDHHEVQLTWWFIKSQDPTTGTASWSHMVNSWLSLLDNSGRYALDPPIVCRLEDITALDYVESVRLDLDQLSFSQS